MAQYTGGFVRRGISFLWARDVLCVPGVTLDPDKFQPGRRGDCLDEAETVRDVCYSRARVADIDVDEHRQCLVARAKTGGQRLDLSRVINNDGNFVRPVEPGDSRKLAFSHLWRGQQQVFDTGGSEE